MKYLVLILALLIALPTASAGACGMGSVQDPVEQPADSGHDCCPNDASDTADPAQPCEDGNHCAGCFISVALVTLSLQAAVQQSPQNVALARPPLLVPSHSAPPYRPPIS